MLFHVISYFICNILWKKLIFYIKEQTQVTSKMNV